VPDGAPIRHQLRNLRRALIVVYLPTLLVMGALVVINRSSGIALRSFFIDPVAEFNAPVYIGFVSNLGVVLLCSGAAACLLAGTLLFGRAGLKRESIFLLSAGAFTTVLMFDDLFLLHEEVLPERLGIPEPVVYALYGGALLGLFLYNRRQILGSRFVLGLIAVLFFGLSIGFDLLEKIYDSEDPVFGIDHHLLEDGPKLMGIESWTMYLWLTAYQTLAGVVGKANPG
jgi:hypothetical protein